MIYEEFICYNKGFSADKNDFYGAQSPWTFSQQKEFLKAYLADYKKRYGEDCLYEKAVSEQEIDEAVTKIEKSSDFFAAYKKTAKKLKTEQQKQAFKDQFDWYRMTEQDMEIWSQVFEVLKS